MFQAAQKCHQISFVQFRSNPPAYPDTFYTVFGRPLVNPAYIADRAGTAGSSRCLLYRIIGNNGPDFINPKQTAQYKQGENNIFLRFSASFHDSPVHSLKCSFLTTKHSQSFRVFLYKDLSTLVIGVFLLHGTEFFGMCHAS